ncbi:MAG: hypothetical protein WAV76_06055 [Bacteroidota bacterium]
MQPEKRIEILMEVEALKKAVKEPNMFTKKSLLLSVMGAFLVTLCGLYMFVKVVDLIVKDGISYIVVVFLFIAIVFIVSPWYFIVRHQINKRLLLIYEALLSNDSETSAS